MVGVGLLLTTLLFSLAATAVQGAQVSCSVTDPSTNEVYDLSSLIRTSGEDWLAVNKVDADYIYRLNVCNNVLYTSAIISSNSGAYQQRVDDLSKHYSLGQVASPTIDSGILKITYTNGTYCNRSGKNRTTILTFACDTDGNVGQPVFLYESDDMCVYFFDWKTKAACPVSSTNSASGAVIFLVIVAVLTALYFILGILYNRCVAGKRGFEQLPNYTFWSALASTLKCWPDKKVVHYRQLPRTADGADELNPDEFDDDAIENGDEHT